MASGSGAWSVKVVGSAGDLVLERVSGIVPNRVRPALPSFSLLFGKSNQGVHLSAASRPQVTPSVRLCGVEVAAHG